MGALVGGGYVFMQAGRDTGYQAGPSTNVIGSAANISRQSAKASGSLASSSSRLEANNVNPNRSGDEAQCKPPSNSQYSMRSVMDFTTLAA